MTTSSVFPLLVCTTYPPIIGDEISRLKKKENVTDLINWVDLILLRNAFTSIYYAYQFKIDNKGTQ